MCTTLNTTRTPLWCALQPHQGCATHEGTAQGQEPTVTGSRRKDSFFGVRVEETQTASFPVKTLKGKMSFPIVSADRISSPHGRTLVRSSTSSIS